MFPDDQDAPPARPTTARLPRPPQSRRLFSSGRDGQPYTIEVFGNDQLSPTVSMRGHRQALEAAGFRVTEREYTPSRVTYNAQRSDVTLTIVVASDDMGGCTTSVLASEVVQ